MYIQEVVNAITLVEWKVPRLMQNIPDYLHFPVSLQTPCWWSTQEVHGIEINLILLFIIFLSRIHCIEIDNVYCHLSSSFKFLELVWPFIQALRKYVLLCLEIDERKPTIPQWVRLQVPHLPLIWYIILWVDHNDSWSFGLQLFVVEDCSVRQVFLQAENIRLKMLRRTKIQWMLKEISTPIKVTNRSRKPDVKGIKDPFCCVKQGS